MADENTPAADSAAEPRDEGGITVEIEKPRGKPPIPDTELEKLTSGGDDEIARANEEARKQVKGLRVAYQEQRRKAEQWSRDATTATSLAEQLYRENQELKQNITRSESALIDQALRRAEAQLENARSKSRQALTAGDADLIVASNEDMARAAGEVDRLKLLKPAAQAADREAHAAVAEPAGAAPRPQPPPPPPASARTEAWVRAHPWFGYDPAQGHDVEMTKFAMRQHTHLAVDGITEENNPDLYWRTIEDKLKETYPDRFGARAETHARPVVTTGSTRSNGAPAVSAGGRRVVKLTESEVSLARRLNVTPEQYAVEKLKYEQEQERETKRSIQ